MPINGDFSEYSVQVFDLKDGIVIYSPAYDEIYGKYGEYDPIYDMYGEYSPFCTIGSDGRNGISLLYGDYTSLMETELGEVSQKQKDGVRFTASPETNTIYYENNAYTFDFTKVEAGFDEDSQMMIPCFTVWHPSEQISAE